MKNLSKTEQFLLLNTILEKFHEKSEIVDERIRCWEWINIAKKLDAPKEFIEELESNYNSEFNK